jgi:hypothetical protein
MSLSISRIGDTGEGEDCADPRLDPVSIKKHAEYTTTYTTGASTVFINNLAVTTITSLGEQSCGEGIDGEKHISVATTGSSTVFVENLAVHRVGDIGDGDQIERSREDTYTSKTGSPDVFAG